MRWRAGSDDDLKCSFCHKSQDVVGKLISSPSDYPRAYICDECIAVCNSILEDYRNEKAPGPEQHAHAEPADPISDDPLLSDFFDVAERWLALEIKGEDASESPAEMKRIAARMK